MTFAPVSVVVPTIGRETLLRDCLASIAGCNPGPAEIVVVDQSRDDATRRLVGSFAEARARHVPCDGVGISRNMNVGLAHARQDHVLVTHDDCTVAPDWVGVGAGLLAGTDDLIVSGRVEPAGADLMAVPSTKVDPLPYDYTGERHCGGLFPNNMGLPRASVLALGGFDERLWFAEDNDLGYRWLRTGRRLHYRPELVVEHRDWRGREAVRRLYVEYWHHQGIFYAKHLRRRDRTILRFMATDAHQAARHLAARALRGREPWSDPRSGIVRGLPSGLRAGLRTFPPKRRRRC